MAYSQEMKRGCARCIDGQLDQYTESTASTGFYDTNNSQIIYKCDKCGTEYAERLLPLGGEC